ncbi:MAG TPA: flagellar filament capping protein FliD, partial [Thermoguttaceae bacterium]|nr:flagellar filament capping protein FliD [Thermoguttaceae bacterium]
TNTADKLQIAVNAAVHSVNSGDLHLRIISQNTLLSTLNGGGGVAKGQFYIKDSSGRTTTIDLRSSNIQTIGDVIRTINTKTLNVRAEINSTGDGILLRDTAGGAGKLTVTEAGSTTAKDLGLLRTATTVVEEGQTRQIIDGSMTYQITLASTNTLQDLHNKINALGGGFNASLLNDGSFWPWRLSLVSERSGKAGALVVDTAGLGISFQETSRAQDAKLLYGPASSAASAMVINSSSNTFTNVIDGVSLQIKQATGTTVAVQVNTTNTVLLASAKTLVENYNKFRDQLEDYTKYDTTTGKGSVLTGDSTALRLDTALSSLLSGQFTSNSQFQSLAALGLTLTDKGKLEFDQEKFEAAYAEDPQGVQEFFTASETGMANQLNDLIEQLAGEEDSTVSERLEALDSKISTNLERIEHMTDMLDKERTRLLTQFYNMELAVAKIQSSLDALDSIAWITQQNKSKSNSK